jgi:hypothetical protein
MAELRLSGREAKTGKGGGKEERNFVIFEKDTLK